MSVIQKLIEAQDNQDLKAYNEVLSEDYYWLRHSTGEKVPRDELSKWLISPDAPKSENARIIYENDEKAFSDRGSGFVVVWQCLCWLCKRCWCVWSSITISRYVRCRYVN